MIYVRAFKACFGEMREKSFSVELGEVSLHGDIRDSSRSYRVEQGDKGR